MGNTAGHRGTGARKDRLTLGGGTILAVVAAAEAMRRGGLDGDRTRGRGRGRRIAYAVARMAHRRSRRLDLPHTRTGLSP